MNRSKLHDTTQIAEVADLRPESARCSGPWGPPRGTKTSYSIRFAEPSHAAKLTWTPSPGFVTLANHNRRPARPRGESVMTPTARKVRKYRLLGLVLAAAIGGCGRWQNWNWQDQATTAGPTGWTNGDPAPNSGAGGSGLDNRAREIERGCGGIRLTLGASAAPRGCRSGSQE